MNKAKIFFILTMCVCILHTAQGQTQRIQTPAELMGHRFLTLNTVIRVNQIEVSRDRNVGEDERDRHTPERIRAFRNAVETGFPGARITWAFSWLALHDTTANYREIRKIVAGYHKQYGDDITFIPGAYFANAYNTYEQINRDLHEGLAKASEIVGDGFRPKSVVAGFLAAPNLQYLAEKEDIHVCQGTIWSQFSIDNQDGDGSIAYPYYPSKEHFCKPAQGKDDFIDCVNLDGWTTDFLAARRNGFADGFNSRMGVGPIETLYPFGKRLGLEEMIHSTAIHFDNGFDLNGFAWVTNCWEVCLPDTYSGIAYSGIADWLDDVRRRWPDTKIITQGEFGLLWRQHYRDNSFNYRFEEKGSGIGGSDADKEIRWFMNKNFRLALIRNWQTDTQDEVIDFTRYDVPAQEPQKMTRSWSLLGEINQKQTRPQDKPVPLNNLPEEYKQIIRRQYPYLFPLSLTAQNKPQIIAHRGYWQSRGSAANSIAALEGASKIRVYGSEFDVQMTADNVLVINHDESIKGVSINKSPYSAIKDSTLNNGEKIPTLREYLEAAKHTDIRLIFELKPADTPERTREAVRQSVEMVREKKLMHRTEFITFGLDAGKEFIRLAPETNVHYLSGDLSPKELKDLGFAGLDYNYNVMRKHSEWFKQAKALGLSVNVWTVDNQALMREMIDAGADYITTDNPNDALIFVSSLFPEK